MYTIEIHNFSRKKHIQNYIELLFIILDSKQVGNLIWVHIIIFALLRIV